MLTLPNMLLALALAAEWHFSAAMQDKGADEIDRALAAIRMSNRRDSADVSPRSNEVFQSSSKNLEASKVVMPQMYAARERTAKDQVKIDRLLVEQREMNEKIKAQRRAIIHDSITKLDPKGPQPKQDATESELWQTLRALQARQRKAEAHTELPSNIARPFRIPRPRSGTEVMTDSRFSMLQFRSSPPSVPRSSDAISLGGPHRSGPPLSARVQYERLFGINSRDSPHVQGSLDTDSRRLDSLRSVSHVHDNSPSRLNAQDTLSLSELHGSPDTRRSRQDRGPFSDQRRDQILSEQQSAISSPNGPSSQRTSPRQFWRPPGDLRRNWRASPLRQLREQNNGRNRQAEN